MWLAVTTTSLDDALRAGMRFSQLLNLRVFQQYLREAATRRLGFDRIGNRRKN
jgi:hypothetical protein